MGWFREQAVKIRVKHLYEEGRIEADDVGIQYHVAPEWESQYGAIWLESDHSHGQHVRFDNELTSQEFTLASPSLEVDYKWPEVATVHKLHFYVYQTPGDTKVYDGYVECWDCSRDWTTAVLNVGEEDVGKTVYVKLWAQNGKSLVDNVGSNQMGQASLGGHPSADDGDPFDTTTGQFTHAHTDLLIPGRGVPLEFTRTYQSFSSHVGDLGPRWTHTYSASLRIDGDGSVTVRYPGGGTAYFELDGGSFTPPPGVHDTLVKNGDDTYTLTTKAQIEYDFSTVGKLAAISDRNDNTTSVSYDGNGKLSSVTDSSLPPRSLTFSYEDSNYPDQITKVADPIAAPDTRTVQFAYDAVTGDLVTVTDVKGGNTYYAYSNHRMTSLTDANDHTASQNIYDTAGRAVEQTDAESGVTCAYYGSGPTYTSTNCPGVSPAPQAGQTVVVDQRGKATTYDFDTSFRTTDITNVVDSVEHVVHYDYDSDNNVTCVTDQEGHKTGFDYDGVGNVEEIIDALNTDPNCELKTGGTSWSFTYNSLNDIELETDPRDNKTDYVYDLSGNLTRIIRRDSADAVKGLTCLERDSETGQLTALVASTDLVVPPGPSDPCTGHTTTFTYDDYGLLDEVDGPLTGPPNDLTDYDFDTGGRLTSVTDAEGNTTSFEYDAQNNVVKVIDPENGENAPTAYRYDQKGNRTSVTSAKRPAVGAPENPDPETGQCGDPPTLGNGADDDADTVIDDGCPTTIFAYWDSDRLKSVTDALGRVTSYDYDDAGNLEMRTDGRGRVTTYEYDDLNRLTDVKHWETWVPPVIGDTVEYKYYKDGLRESMEDSTGTTGYTYFDNHQLKTVTDPAMNVVQYTYDDAGNRETITYPGTPTKTVTYEYDAFDRIETVTDWMFPPNVTTYDYDNVGNLWHTYYPPDGLTTTRDYDEADRLESVTNNKGLDLISSFEYDLDAVGNRTRVVDNVGEIEATTDYGYDDLYRLRNVVNLESQLDTYHYDEVGNRLYKWANEYEYDAADQMTSAYTTLDTDGDGCTDSEELEQPNDGEPPLLPGETGPYDPLGYWDFYDVPVPANADPEPNGPKNGAVTLGDVLAILQYVGTFPTCPAETTCGEALPPNSPDCCTDNLDPGPPEKKYDYDADKDGDTLADGLAYDRSPSAEPDPPFDAGPPNDAVTMGDVLVALGQVGLGCAGPPNEEPLPYGYDDNGNQDSRDPADSFEYDHENRLVEATIGGGTSTYDYNGDGLRVSRTVASATTDYVWDVGAALPVILQETAGGQTTYYVHGLDLISSIEGTAPTYYLTDGLGSTTELTNSAGTVTDTYRYDAFGALRSSTGSSAQPFRFTGEQWDSESGFYYLRARYYDPAIGRFVSKDPIPFSQRYAYVGSNPVNFVDPLGLHCKPWHPHHCAGEKASDLADWGRTFVDHPGSVLQQTLGTLVALTSSGDRRREGGVTFYENCWGSCWFLKLMDPEAITLGHNVFAEHPLDEPLITHELAHVRQGDEYGLLWLPSYLGEELRHGYACNRFEEEARRAAGEASRCPGPGKE